MTIPNARPRYLSVAETAKAIRPTLRAHFPGVTFSVRSKSYSGGASIDISWTDGPREKEVQAIADGFEGASFDGMNDLQSSQDSWLMPDGTADLAARPDSYGGSIPGYVSDAPHPDAELVHFGASFIFCSRDVTDFEIREQAAADCIRQRCHCEGEAPNDRFGMEWVSNMARRMAHDFAEGETTEQTFERVILRN